MSARAIWEATGKDLINRNLNYSNGVAKCRFAVYDQSVSWSQLVQQEPWLETEKLVVKPDQLIKRRGKLGLIKVNVDFTQVQEWVNERIDKDVQVGKATGKLRRFIIEPFVAHKDEEEAYVCIYSERNGDVILFHHQGGVDIGDVDEKALRLSVEIDSKPSREDILSGLLVNVTDDAKKERVADYIVALYDVYVDLHFTYMEINPLVVTAEGGVFMLDLAAKIDATADFLCRTKWGNIEYPPPFGRDAYPEEAYIADLDSKSGASLKLTILNRAGRIWTMVAGGGASVIYSDTICDLGGAAELANYGEYSGAPSEQQTYEYAKTILSLMTQDKHPDGKVLIIGGGIANFTNVAATFKGIVKALLQYQTKLVDHKVSIFVRRAGPNYQEGLRVMREVGANLGIPVHVFGPETHMTAVVGMALGTRPIPSESVVEFSTANFLLPGGQEDEMPRARAVSQDSGVGNRSSWDEKEGSRQGSSGGASSSLAFPKPLFTSETKAIVWGMQTRAVQSMLDFDFVCRRKEPSVAAMVYPFTGDHKQKFYWGHGEVFISVYKSMDDAMKKHPTADVMVNFASLRSAYDSTVEAMNYPQIRTIAIIAEGIPENSTRKLNKLAASKNVAIIGPATVGGIKPGCLKIGNTGGMMDNILHSKLYRPGSVAYVSRLGGMSNELNNIIAHHSNGVCEGVAIGGDRYPGTTFIDHLLRYQNDPEVKMLVLLGEVGGVEEYDVCRALTDGRITKPIIAWCIGTCASMFSSEVQFGHAGACANAERETALVKNKALAEAGGHVPQSFDDLGEVIEKVYKQLVQDGTIVPREEVPPPTVPMDYSWARELGLIRKPASFMTSVSDERGQELLYAGMPISEVLKQNLGIGGVISLLWFQRRLPVYACKFIEMCLMVTADHGPAVSGAHNTIVCARAGKDLVSSLVSGLLTIGDRFGGALDAAARQFSEAYDIGQHPMEFVNSMRKKGELIMGVGHRVKSINNPDMRVTIIKEFLREHFPATPLLDYALEVEKITTSKKPNLISHHRRRGLFFIKMSDVTWPADGDAAIASRGKAGRPSTPFKTPVFSRPGSRIGSTPSPGPSSRSSRGSPSPLSARRRLTFGENVDDPETFVNVATTHPADIVESASLASVATPDTSYTLDLPEGIGLSPLQKETIKIASNQHKQILPDGSRAGFFIGDGTGVGKGRMIAGLIFENYRQGKKRAIWISVSNDLKFAAEQDIKDIGAGKEIPVHALKDMRYGHRISGRANGKINNGVIFTTYACLIAEAHSSGEHQTRMDQILKWCHEDFDGIIVFDECHQAKNSFPVGSTEPTKTGLAVIKLQNKLPKARVLYVSATGASEPRHLGYMVRLGLWGKGTPFNEFTRFVEAVEKGGVGAMEMVAMEMKHRGMYIARQLSLKDVEFRVEKVALSPKFIKAYNDSAKLWVQLLQSFAEAIDLMNVDLNTSKVIWNQFWSAHQRFFNCMIIASKVTHVVQAANNAVKNGKCVVIGLQSTGEARTLKQMENEGELSDFVSTAKGVLQALVDKHFPAPDRSRVDGLEKGASLLAQPGIDPESYGEGSGISGAKRNATLEAVERSKNKARPSDRNSIDHELESHSEDLECRSSKVETKAKKKDKMVKAEEERKKKEDALNEEVKPPTILIPRPPSVLDKKEDLFNRPPPKESLNLASAIRDMLLARIEKLGTNLPPNTLDQLIDELGGPENVAEMTGRKGRVVQNDNGQVKYESRAENLNKDEMEKFMKGEKLVAIISQATSIGTSLHADKAVTNTRRRVHITLELPWSADKAIQQFGRTHRSNQAVTPEYVMFISDLAGEKRFVSSVAKRLESLGALTHGDRRATETCELSQFNIDTKYGREALEATLEAVMGCKDPVVPAPMNYKGTFFTDVKEALVGVGLISKSETNPNEFTLGKNIGISKFLNRILGMQVDLQNRLFQYFTDTLDFIVNEAKKSDHFDRGIGDLQCQREPEKKKPLLLPSAFQPEQRRHSSKLSM